MNGTKYTTRELTTQYKHSQGCPIKQCPGIIIFEETNKNISKFLIRVIIPNSPILTKENLENQTNYLTGYIGNGLVRAVKIGYSHNPKRNRETSTLYEFTRTRNPESFDGNWGYADISRGPLRSHGKSINSRISKIELPQECEEFTQIIPKTNKKLIYILKAIDFESLKKATSDYRFSKRKPYNGNLFNLKIGEKLSQMTL